MSNNKAARLDGFPTEFYEHFWQTLSSLFTRMADGIKINKSIPYHTNTALISVLLKTNKDPAHCSNYRPISLINIDIKLISKAKHSQSELNQFSSLIHLYQTGFIKGRHSSNNTRRLFNLINISHYNNLKTIILSLDAKKAFDKVNWTFLIKT